VTSTSSRISSSSTTWLFSSEMYSSYLSTSWMAFKSWLINCLLLSDSWSSSMSKKYLTNFLSPLVLYANWTRDPSLKLLSTDSNKTGFCLLLVYGVSTLTIRPSVMNMILPEIKCRMMYFFLVFDFVVVYSYSAITPTPTAPVWSYWVTVLARYAWSPPGKIFNLLPPVLMEGLCPIPDWDFLGLGDRVLPKASSCFSAF